jgi:hypothetical protein
MMSRFKCPLSGGLSLAGVDPHGAGGYDDAVLAQIIESWFVSIRNQPVVTGADGKRWQAGFGFVTDVVAWLSKSVAADDRLLQSVTRGSWNWLT